MTALQSAEAGGPVSANENFCAQRDRNQAGRYLRRQLPADFASHAVKKSLHALKRHYQTNERTIRRWYDEAGVSQVIYRSSPHPVPGDFREQALTLHLTALSRLYGVNERTVRRWADKLGVRLVKLAASGHAVGVPVPEGFAAIAPTMTRRQLSESYRVSIDTVDRWLGVAGVKPKRATFTFDKTPPVAPATDGSVASQAAHFLRRYYPSVYRVDILPKEKRSCYPNQGKDMWIVAGLGAIVAAQIIAMATAKGFNAGTAARI